MIPTREIILGCWIVFLLVWLASAGFVKKTAERSSWVLRLVSVVPVALGSMLLFWDEPYGWLGLRLIGRSAAFQAIAVTTVLAGLVIAVWARFVLAGNWSGMVTLKEGHELVVRGPYRAVRHPIYTGILLMLLGTAVAVGRLSGLVGFLIVLASFVFKLRQEEALLARHFPASYPAYMARVKALVPFVF
jgi:protein-S-isoprenylcysteine O-methyltransferase Ste14